MREFSKKESGKISAEYTWDKKKKKWTFVARSYIRNLCVSSKNRGDVREMLSNYLRFVLMIHNEGKVAWFFFFLVSTASSFFFLFTSKREYKKANWAFGFCFQEVNKQKQKNLFYNNLESTCRNWVISNYLIKCLKFYCCSLKKA